MVVADFLVQESFVHKGQVRCSCKLQTKQMLLSVVQLFISLRMEKCYTLKGQSLETRLSCIFQAIGNILNSKKTKINMKETDLIGSQISWDF